MDATSTESENNKIKIASGRFYKDKAARENKVELEINMERMGSKIIELHKISKKSRTMLSWDNFNRENALELSGKWNGKINLLNLLTDRFHLMAEKWYW
jgi:ATP-binding cassette subfamily F protein uup